MRQAREERGLSVARLAALAGVSQETVYRIERRATSPRLFVIRRLSAALGLAPETIAEFRAQAGPLRGRRPTIRAL